MHPARRFAVITYILGLFRSKSSRTHFPNERSEETRFLNKLWKCYKSQTETYDHVIRIYTDCKENGSIDLAKVQELLRLLCRHPSSFNGLSELLPRDNIVYVPPDFELTRAVRISLPSMTKPTWRAAFNISATNDDMSHSMARFVNQLLQSTLVDSEREEAITTLFIGDAKCAIALIYEVLRKSRQLAVFTRDITKKYGATIDQYIVKSRMSSLILRLATLKDEIPPILVLPSEDITTEDRSVSGGATCSIYIGSFRKIKVAVKRYRQPHHSTQDRHLVLRKHIYKEVIMWNQLVHPHILGCYGAYRDAKSLFIPFSIVLPWMKQGNIRQYVATLSHDDETSRLLVSWIYQVAEGLQYLHETGIVHMDIRGANILLDDSARNAMITDFGSAIWLQTVSDPVGGPFIGCTKGWAAPECGTRDPQLPTNSSSTPRRCRPIPKAILHRADIYSLGCTIIELYTRADPNLSDAGSSSNQSGSSGVSGQDMPNELEVLVQHCQREDPYLRPSASDFKERLSVIS